MRKRRIEVLESLVMDAEAVAEQLAAMPRPFDPARLGPLVFAWETVRDGVALYVCDREA
jgi:hypothetical protein